MNESKNITGRTAILAVWLTFTVLLASFYSIYRSFFPLPNFKLGHDYLTMLPAWLDGLFWLKKNGLTVPWFSPSFCGGQPFFPDPQSIFFSIPQFINFYASPLNTAILTLLLSATLLFWGGYLLMRRVFFTGPVVATLVGGLLMFNGFLPHRMLVGHVIFHGFALVPWIALFLLMPIHRRFNNLMASLAAGLLLAYWIYSGFGTLTLAGGLSILLLALLYGLKGGSLTPFLQRSLFAGIIGFGLSIAKLWAAFSFLSNFPRTSYLLPGAQSVLDSAIIIISGLFLPSQWAFNIGTPMLKNVQWFMAPHEWAYNFGIAAALLLFALIISNFLFKKRAVSFTKREVLLSIGILLCLAWPLLFNFWNPTWHKFIKSIPIINSASTALRWIIVYIPIVGVVIGLLLDRSNWGRAGNIAAGLCLLGVVTQCFLEPRDYYQSQPYDSRPISMADVFFRNGILVPEIKSLGIGLEIEVNNTPLSIGSNDTFIAGMSQIFCSNAVFGYRLENFNGKDLTIGPALAEKNGYLNLKNPACYVYPKENDCRPGDRFRADQMQSAKAFLEYRPFPFNMSEGQKLANLITLLSLAGTILIILIWTYLGLMSFIARRRAQGFDNA